MNVNQQILNFQLLIEKLEKEIFLLKEVIETVPGDIYWKDKEGNYLWMNKRGCDSLKKMGFPWERDDIIGKTDFNLFKEQTAEEYRKNDLAVMSSKGETVREEINVLPSGEKLIQLSIKRPLVDENGQVIGVIGNTIDITYLKNIEADLRKAKEIAEAASKAKSAFIANMSHDIRTPLTGVIGMAQILEADGDSKRDREYAQTIHQSSEKLLSLLNDILEIISADEIKEGELDRKTFSLFERLKQIYEIFAPNARLKNIQFKVEIDSNLPEYIVSDRIKLDRILLNLVSNALKFTHVGQVMLVAQCSSRHANQAWVKFLIRDTGVGIPKDKIQHIFDQFYRVTPAYEGKYEGFGIGLSIVKRFVELLGGSITVKSELGRGSEFEVIVPFEIGKLEEAIHGEAIEIDRQAKIDLKKYGKSLSDKKKLLLIEDDAIARKAAIATLKSIGFEIDAADRAEAGFKLMMDNTYELIITDVGLPGIDGNQFASLVRAFEKISHQARVPIVGLSAHSGKEEEAREAGMDLLLSKPLNEQKIERIKSIILSSPPSTVTKEKNSRKEVYEGLGKDLPNTENALFELESYPLLDESEGLKNTGDDPNFLQELLSLLIDKTIPNELVNLEKAHGALDWEQIRGIAHKLKGAAVYCGTIKMKYACHYLERYLLAGHSKLCEELYSQLREVLENTLKFLKNYLSSRGIN